MTIVPNHPEQLRHPLKKMQTVVPQTKSSDAHPFMTQTTYKFNKVNDQFLQEMKEKSH